MKKRFKLAVAYQMCGTIVVEAENIDEAIDIAKNDLDIGLPEDAEYIDGSWEVDRDVSVELNDAEDYHANKCPECGSQMKVVVGDRADCSYGEFKECPECGYNNGEKEPEDNMTDVEADADTLASAGWGTDEDYGYFGDEPGI